MARPLRIEYPGAVYHITSRGNARQSIFLEDKDREKFLEILSDTKARYNWLCHGFFLMNIPGTGYGAAIVRLHLENSRLTG